MVSIYWTTGEISSVLIELVLDDEFVVLINRTYESVLTKWLHPMDASAEEKVRCPADNLLRESILRKVPFEWKVHTYRTMLV